MPSSYSSVAATICVLLITLAKGPGDILQRPFTGLIDHVAATLVQRHSSAPSPTLWRLLKPRFDSGRILTYEQDDDITKMYGAWFKNVDERLY